jgi:hypothetical protein
MVLYAAFLAAAPFEHHDLLCDLKTPQHCTVCTASVVGSDPSTPALVGAWTLTDLGCAAGTQVVARGALLVVRTSGRSPPTSL